MGTVMSYRKKEDNMLLNVEVDVHEALQMKGHVEDVHVFSEQVTHLTTKISTRGKKSATKYLLIPRIIRENLNYDGDVRCQILDLNGKTALIYLLNTNG